jgi:serine O-acetyltransferase
VSHDDDGAASPSIQLGSVASALALSYLDGRCQHVGRGFIPSRNEVIEILELLLGLLYPGFFGERDLSAEGVEAHVAVELGRVREKLERQVERCVLFTQEEEPPPTLDRVRSRRAAGDIALALLARLPEIRRRLVLDAEAAFAGDPAARSLDEIVLAYPGFLAISVHRIAHELHELEVPLMPRIMSEWAHTRTGADIHPGAIIGERFFIDHATGVVVGETTRIGDGVRLYQGVTLGAISLPRDEVGRVVRGEKRHPTVEDNVTIYANATVLGGTTVLGRGAVIGGSVFLTKSVAPGQRVALEAPRLRVAAQLPEFEI